MSNDPFASTPTADPFAGDPPPTTDADDIKGSQGDDGSPTADPDPGQPVGAAPAPAAFDPVSQTVAEAPTAPQEAPQAPEAPPESPPAPDAPADAPEAPAAPPDPGTGDVSPAVPPQPDATPQTETQGEASTNGERTGPRGGKGEMRHYKLLYQTGPATWTEFDLKSVPEDAGITVVNVANEVWFEARNNEHANRLGFTIVGRPSEGARIFPVPRGAYKPKTVKPAPPQPARERVVIS